MGETRFCHDVPLKVPDSCQLAGFRGGPLSFRDFPEHLVLLEQLE